MREKVFTEESFQVCVNIDSSITPEVALSRDKKVLESKEQTGEFCFSTPAPDKPGEYNYSVRALTYGQDASASRSVEVLEQGEEVESFPDQVTSVETDESLVKVDLYNTNSETRNYTISLNGINSDWMSNPTKESSLETGERDTVYFYLSPNTTGNFTGRINVETQGQEIYTKEVSVYSTNSKSVERSMNWYFVLAAVSNIVF